MELVTVRLAPPDRYRPAPPEMMLTTALAADHARRTHHDARVCAWLDGFGAALRWAAGEGPLPEPPRTINP